MYKRSFVIALTLFIFISYLYSQNSEQTQKLNSDTNYKNITLSIDSLLSKYNLTKTQYSIAIYSLNNKKFIYEKNADLQLKPASVTKLFTSFATYWLVGDTFNFRTKVYTDDSNIKDGVINGDLYIVGGGDCLMELANLDEMIRQIQNQGIKKITGNIIGDGRLYNDENNRFAYSGDYDEVEPVAPISALSIEQNRFKILLNSSVNTTQPKIQIIPSAANVQIVSNVKIYSPAPAKKKATKKKSSSYFQIYQQNYGDRIPLDISLLAASQTRISAHSKLQDNGTQVIYISGSMPKNSNAGVQEFILSPTLSFASVFRNRLINSGISVEGKFSKVQKTDKIDYSKMKEIAEFSRPINDVIQQLNKNSDNYIAENLFKFNGAIANKDTGTVVSAKKFYDSLFATFMQPNQLPILNDGSGLSRRNKASAKSIVQLLEKASQSHFFKSYLSTLSIAGIDGTLSKRMRGTIATNNLMAKTGTHRDVSSLAGYTNTLDGEIFIFAFVFNGPNVGIYKQLENDISLIISNYTNYIPYAK
ncbi:MAG TPA: D-alanyl-D-alanine carboxypeptidase/D-alanyl-D-alanine-endopeptidase [Candidatus Kapabacteria bacterium]|nr:D-alanyl-D-alanine carboxypeptidase/D-alanyl-D-alanine-endopeptidase [Candidatus Kapabacteria bacterium]